MSIPPVTSLDLIKQESITLERDVQKEEVIQSIESSVEIFGHVGEKAMIIARYSITIHGNVGKKATLASKKGRIKARNLADEVEMNGAKGIDVKRVGNCVTLKSGYFTNIRKDTGSHCKITSKCIVKARNLGDHNTILTTWEGVKAMNVGDNTIIIAEKGGVFLNKLGEGGKILISQNDVHIKEPVPDSVYICKPINGEIRIADNVYTEEIKETRRSRTEDIHTSLPPDNENEGKEN